MGYFSFLLDNKKAAGFFILCVFLFLSLQMYYVKPMHHGSFEDEIGFGPDSVSTLILNQFGEMSSVSENRQVDDELANAKEELKRLEAIRDELLMKKKKLQGNSQGEKEAVLPVSVSNVKKVDANTVTPISNVKSDASKFEKVGGKHTCVTNSECPYIKHGNGASMFECHESCLNSSTCTVVNFDGQNRDCVLRACPPNYRNSVDSCEGFVVYKLVSAGLDLVDSRTTHTPKFFLPSSLQEAVDNYYAGKPRLTSGVDFPTAEPCSRKYPECYKPYKCCDEYEGLHNDMIPLQLDPCRNGKEKCVIAMSVYGNNSRYVDGAIDNIPHSLRVYPGWILRFYHDASVPAAALEKLRSQPSTELIFIDDIKGTQGNNKYAGTFWRFLVANDPNVDRYVVRDSDSFLLWRERLSVDAWILSGRAFHVMRDHPYHDSCIMAGMWGGVKNALPISSVTTPIRAGQYNNLMSFAGGDQVYLKEIYLKHFTEDMECHDSFHCMSFDGCKGFPSRRVNPFDFVGRYDHPGAIKYEIHSMCPVECRPNQDWLHC